MWIPLNVAPTDCESCGTSYDELTVEFDANPGERGPWVANLRIGCTGAESVTGSRSDVIDWLTGRCASYVDFDVLSAAIETLRNA